MSLDIALYDRATDEEVASMNWLRNPFGLERWAETNVAYLRRGKPLDCPMRLYDVCNRWAYDQANQIDRPLFQRVVLAYWAEIQRIEHGYFWFLVSSLEQFVLPNLDHFPLISDPESVTAIVGIVSWGDAVGIPQEYFGHAAFHLSDEFRPDYHTLYHYKEWFTELTVFAEQLQDRRNRFYCSN